MWSNSLEEEQAEYGEVFAINDYDTVDIYEEIGLTEADNNELEIIMRQKKELETKLQRLESDYVKLKEEKEKAIQNLQCELEKIITETCYVDLDKETLKLMFCKERLKVLNLESEIQYPNNKSRPIYLEGYVEKVEFDGYFTRMKNHLISVLPPNYILALEEISQQKNTIRRLEVDNKILKDKVGGIEVKNSERIKAGFSNVKKPQADPKLIIALLDQGLTKTEVAKRLKISRQTVYNALKID